MDRFDFEDPAYLEWKRRKKAAMERCRAGRAERGDLRDLSAHSVARIRATFERSVPTMASARRLFDLVQERLGDRAVLDPATADFEHSLVPSDPERPGWYLPETVLYLSERSDVHEPGGVGPGGGAETVLPTGGGPGKLLVRCGPAEVTWRFGQDGVLATFSFTGGDPADRSRDPEVPIRIDPHMRPAQFAPVSLLLRADLDPGGVPLERLAEWIVALRPLERHHVRVHLPVPIQGFWRGAWWHGRRRLKELAWRGELPEGPCWLVVDGWNGAALASGDTFEEAFAAWREQVQRVQPVRPPDRVTRNREARARREARKRAIDLAWAERTAAQKVVRLPGTGPERHIISSGPVTITAVAPVQVDWPEARPENVSAVALRLPASPPIPESLRRNGFQRVLPLVSERGEWAFAFLRVDPDGYTLVGEDAVDAIDVDTLDEALDEELGFRAIDHAEAWGDAMADSHGGSGNPYIETAAGASQFRFWTRDELGREPRLRGAGGSFGYVHDLPAQDPQLQHQVVRIRIRDDEPWDERP